MRERIPKCAVKEYIREVTKLADAHDALSSNMDAKADLKMAQENAQKQTHDIFNLVEKLKDINRS
jgi:hypothetical protein